MWLDALPGPSCALLVTGFTAPGSLHSLVNSLDTIFGPPSLLRPHTWSLHLPPQKKLLRAFALRQTLKITIKRSFSFQADLSFQENENIRFPNNVYYSAVGRFLQEGVLLFYV